MVTFQKYQGLALRRLKIGLYWVLLRKFFRREIPVERSDNTTFRLAYVPLKPYFQCGLWARDLNNSQQDAPKIQQRSQAYGRVGVTLKPTSGILRNNSIGKQRSNLIG